MSQTKAQLLNPLGDFTLPGLLIGVGATFSGNVSIAGTLTKQDVTNVDSVGVVTARSGVNISGGNLQFGGTNVINSGLALYNLDSIKLADDKELKLGSSDDLKLYHNGAHSYIHENGNGALKVKGDDIRFENVAGEEALRITSQGSVGIGSYSPVGTLDVTTTAGAGSTVFIYAANHDASSISQAELRFGFAHSGSPEGIGYIKLKENGTNVFDGNLVFGVPNNNGSGGSVTNDVLTIKGSNQNVGINDSSPDTRLSVNSGTTDVVAKFTSSDANAWIQFRDNSTTDTGVMVGANGDDLLLRAGSNERVRIGSSGQIGLGGANYGTAGQVIASGGSGAAPSWTTISAAPEIEGTASGAITAHKSCIVNANGTISQVLQTVVPATTAKQDTELTNDGTYMTGDVKWITSDKFIMVGRKINDTDKGRYFFGSVTSGGAITLTNSALWTGVSNQAWNTRLAIDSSTNKVMVLTQLDGDNSIYMRAGEINSGGTDIDWESANWWSVGNGQKSSTIATDNNGGYMIAYRRSDNNMHFRHVQLNASGSPQDVSSEASWTYYNTNNGDYANGENRITMDYVPSVGAYWCVMEDYNRFYYSPNGIWLSGGGYFRACWVKSNGTGSAPTLTLANQDVFAGAAGSQSAATANSMGYDPRFVYDPTSGKGILAYRPSHTTSNGKALVLSFTDTSAQPTYTGTGVVVTQNSCSGLRVTVSTGTNMKKVVFYSSETGNTLVRSFEVSGTTLVGAGNTLNIFPGQHYQNLDIDSNNFDNSVARFITMTQDEGNGEYLSASTVDLPIVNTNLTDENFIGFAADSYADTATAKVKVVGNTSTQSGLTTAQKYYVKWDGTLSTAPDSQGAPSVTAGRALSATSLLIQPA